MLPASFPHIPHLQHHQTSWFYLQNILYIQPLLYLHYCHTSSSYQYLLLKLLQYNSLLNNAFLIISYPYIHLEILNNINLIILPPLPPKCKSSGFLLNSKSNLLTTILFLDLWSYLLLSILVILLRSYQLSCCFSNIPYLTLCIVLVLCPLPRMFLSWIPTWFASSLHSVSENVASNLLGAFKNSPYSVSTQQFSELSVRVYQGLLCYPLLYDILLLLLLLLLLITHLSSLLFVSFLSVVKFTR